MVGGPLQAQSYAQARAAGATEQRAFFTFLPSLEQGDEGAKAWRFFPSPQDQIDALIAFATDGLNIRAYGAFYPGRRLRRAHDRTAGAKPGGQEYGFAKSLV